MLTSSDGTAVVGGDYGRKNKTLTFAAGETSKTVNIVSKEDDLVEGNETFIWTLFASGADAVPAQISDGVATVTITDDDVVLPSYYSVADTQAYEERALRQISRTGNVSLAHDLTLSWTNGTAFQGFDFTPPTATVSFLAGESSKLIAIQSIEDTLVEPDEAFSITLSSSDTTALFTDDTATLTILNDDAAPVTITNITNNTVNNNQTYLNYNSYSVDKSRNYNIRVGATSTPVVAPLSWAGMATALATPRIQPPSTLTTSTQAQQLLIAYWARKVPMGKLGHTTSLMQEQATTSSVVVVVGM